jgi:hypothetical protein
MRLLLLVLLQPKSDWQPSPHFQAGGREREIKYVVMHTVEGSYQGCISWFKNPKAKVSAHYVVAYDGRVTQFVREEDIAWHAGDKEYNRTSIGIEHEGYADKDGWTLAQYRASAAITAYYCRKYKIPADREHIISHQSITPKRRRDPGPHFNWDLYLALVRGETEAVRKSMPKDKGEVAGSRIEEWWNAAQGAEKRKDWLGAVQLYRRIVFNVEDKVWEPRARRRLEELLGDAEIGAAVRGEEIRREVASWMSIGDTYRNAGLLSDCLQFYERIGAVHPDTEGAREAQRKAEEVRKRIREIEDGK